MVLLDRSLKTGFSHMFTNDSKFKLYKKKKKRQSNLPTSYCEKQKSIDKAIDRPGALISIKRYSERRKRVKIPRN